MEIDVKVTLTIKGQEVNLTLEELKEIRDKINTIIGEVKEKEYVPFTIPRDPFPDPYPWVNPPIVTYKVWSSGDTRKRVEEQ